MSLPGTAGSLPQHSDVLSAAPSSPEEVKNLVAELRRRGNAAFKAGSYLESEMLYTKAIEHDPASDPAVWGNRSAARLGMKKFPEALADADQAVKLGWTKGYFRRGQALCGLKRWRDAQKAYESCLVSDPTNKEAKKEADRAKSKADEIEKADDDMDVIIEDQSAHSQAESNKATVSSEKKPAKTEAAPAKTKNGTENVEEDLDSSSMRGYKILEDGRKTTFFHREIDPEEKAKLAKANKPVAISGPVQQTGSKEGSVWNSAGTFEEKDMTKWATDRIRDLVKGCSTVFESGDYSGVVEATTVSDFDGVASVSFIRGSRRYPFDFTFNVNWTASIEEGEISGKVFYSQFSSDDDTFESEIRWENRDKAGKSAKALYDHIKKEFSAAVDSKLRTFVEEFRKL
jgi:tetratricopeptide (TPR) repeat protein